MLKEFRSIDVYWDKATRRIYKEIRVSSSDEKGRKLTVQIVNDGQIQDLTNVSLNLYWETQYGENRGLDPFEPLDPENGTYELYFRTGMLQHVGKLNAHLHLVDTTGAITSEPFTIVVFSGVDVDAMASDDELSALNKALIEVQNVKQDEAERVSAETERITAEEERVSNENERKTAETTRNTNETTRVSNETDRVNAEDTRKTNETNRVDAESGRVTAEEEREQGYPLLDGRLTTVEQNLDLLTEGGAKYVNLGNDLVLFYDHIFHEYLKLETGGSYTTTFNFDGIFADIPICISSLELLSTGNAFSQNYTNAISSITINNCSVVTNHLNLSTNRSSFGISIIAIGKRK